MNNLHPVMAQALAPFAPAASAVHKFAQTHCSQCGQPQGPGDAGFSACSEHRAVQADLARNAAKNSGALLQGEIDRAHRADVAAGVHQ